MTKEDVRDFEKKMFEETNKKVGSNVTGSESQSGPNSPRSESSDDIKAKSWFSWS